MSAERDHHPTYYVLATAAATLAAISQNGKPDAIHHRCASAEEFARLPGSERAPSQALRTRFKDLLIAEVWVRIEWTPPVSEQEIREAQRRQAERLVRGDSSIPAQQIEAAYLRAGEVSRG